MWNFNINSDGFEQPIAMVIGLFLGSFIGVISDRNGFRGAGIGAGLGVAIAYLATKQRADEIRKRQGN